MTKLRCTSCNAKYETNLKLSQINYAVCLNCRGSLRRDSKTPSNRQKDEIDSILEADEKLRVFSQARRSFQARQLEETMRISDPRIPNVDLDEVESMPKLETVIEKLTEIAAKVESGENIFPLLLLRDEIANLSRIESELKTIKNEKLSHILSAATAATYAYDKLEEIL